MLCGEPAGKIFGGLSELMLKHADEVRYTLESDVQGDLANIIFFLPEQHGRFFQAAQADKLVGR